MAEDPPSAHGSSPAASPEAALGRDLQGSVVLPRAANALLPAFFTVQPVAPWLPSSAVWAPGSRSGVGGGGVTRDFSTPWRGTQGAASPGARPRCAFPFLRLSRLQRRVFLPAAGYATDMHLLCLIVSFPPV